MSEKPSLVMFQKKLVEKVRKKEVTCPKCGNSEDFMVNVLGHVFCNRCYTKIRWLRLE